MSETRLFWLPICVALFLFSSLLFVANYSGFGQILEGFVVEYSGTLISLGTLYLVSFLTFLATYIANKSAETRDKSNRKVQAELKIAEFRQIWINALRDDLAKYLSVARFKEVGEDLKTLEFLSSRILFRLNPEEDEEIPIVSSMNSILKARREQDLVQEEAATAEFVFLSRKLLKTEWDRLKDDLEKAQALERELTNKFFIR